MSIREDPECEHLSASGVDHMPLDDQKKIWRCDECGWLFRCVLGDDGITTRVPR